MRIGIEAQRIFRTKKHGMDIVVLELIKALQETDKDNHYFIFVKKGDDNGCLKETDNFNIVEVPGITYADWEQVFLPLYAAKYNLDVLHCTSNTAPLLYRGHTVVTLHDVIFLEPGKQVNTSNWYQFLGKVYRKMIVPASIRKAKHIVTVSNFEKDRIKEVLGITGDNISVVYNAFGKHFKNNIGFKDLDKIKEKYKLPEHYIFYIGNTDPKKNIYKTLRAYRIYCIKVPTPLPLVIADISPEFLENILEATNTTTLRQNIRLTGYIHNTDLPGIYKAASLFLYPSLRESFGIPLLESMACGTPVITSNTSALPEVAGNAAMLVDPTNEKMIGDSIAGVLNDINAASKLIEQGYNRIEF
ncbi:MAG: glycosyltransferase family 4 protein [Bacteroidetes bacterium]|nr:glycosyltransferase family 4 protein [Bacteroidota bacterium]